jgi:hypothetical protein
MALSFIGHSPSFNIWVFNVNGKEFVARNFSTQSPLQLKFAGSFEKYSGSVPLINTSGFNITESTDKVIVWTWAGKQYTSWWKAESDDIDDPEAQVTLMFGSPVPYSGPPTAPVGNGGVTNTQSPAPPSVPTPVPSLPIDQSQNIMGGGQNQVRVVTPPVTTPAPAPAPAAVTPARTDWVKLGLQLGAAYLLLS